MRIFDIRATVRGTSREVSSSRIHRITREAVEDDRNASALELYLWSLEQFPRQQAIFSTPKRYSTRILFT